MIGTQGAQPSVTTLSFDDDTHTVLAFLHSVTAGVMAQDEKLRTDPTLVGMVIAELIGDSNRTRIPLEHGTMVRDTLASIKARRAPN